MVGRAAVHAGARAPRRADGAHVVARAPAMPLGGEPPAALLQLQRAVGNRAVTAYVQRTLAAPPDTTGGGNDTTSAALVGLRERDGLDWPWEAKRPRVASLQERLNHHLGGSLDTDGMWGSRTTTAVQDFQRRRGLPTAALIDAATANALSGSGGGGGPGGGGGGPASVVRPEVRYGDLNVHVGIAQQKLLASGAADPTSLEVDAEFGSRTRNAVRAFQRGVPMTASGVVDAATWAALDRVAPGGEPLPGGGFTPVRTGARADPTMLTPTGSSSTHPDLALGERGAAVSELHEKLNAVLGTSLPVASDLASAGAIEFTTDTATAVSQYQPRVPQAPTGRVDAALWERLDRDAPGATVGRVERQAVERVRGETGSRGGSVDYGFAITPDRAAPTSVRVQVGYEFTADPSRPPADQGAAVQLILGSIRSVWNRFRAVEEPTPGRPQRGPVDVEFEPRDGGSDRQITLSSGVGPSNARHYFLEPADQIPLLAAHEFGHHIGLADEYQQGAGDHMRHTGEAPPLGQVESPTGIEAYAASTLIRQALVQNSAARVGEATRAVIYDQLQLQQGAYAQRIALRYRRRFGRAITADINARIPQDPSEGSMTLRRLCTHPFLYNVPGLMAGAEMTDPRTRKAPPGIEHTHAVEPRHVRHIVTHLEQAAGGVWNPQAR